MRPVAAQWLCGWRRGRPSASAAPRPGDHDGRTRAAVTAGLCLLLLLLIGRSAIAAPLTVHLAGRVLSVDDPAALLDGSVSEGSAFVGEYAFDSATADAQADPTVGAYNYFAAPAGIEVSVGNYRFASDPAAFDLRIQLFHAPPAPDLFEVISHDNLPLSDTVNVREIYWFLADQRGTALASDHLPAAAPDLARFTADNRFYLAGEGSADSTYLIVAVIDQATVSAGEPAAPVVKEATPAP